MWGWAASGHVWQNSSTSTVGRTLSESSQGFTGTRDDVITSNKRQDTVINLCRYHDVIRELVERICYHVLGIPSTYLLTEMCKVPGIMCCLNFSFLQLNWKVKDKTCRLTLISGCRSMERPGAFLNFSSPPHNTHTHTQTGGMLVHSNSYPFIHLGRVVQSPIELTLG